MLVEDFFSMKEEVLARDFDLGFSGSCEDVVMHAIHLLGNSVVITHTGPSNEFYIAPNTNIPAVFELNFYSNGVLHVYITEAIVGESPWNGILGPAVEYARTNGVQNVN